MDGWCRSNSLASQGKLAYHDKLHKYLSGLAPHIGNLTLHQLLTHTAGVTNRNGDDYESLTLNGLYKHLNLQPLKFEVGTHQYSNLGYSLVTAVIEKVSGMSYEKYLHKEFFAPLGMHNTGYQLPQYSDRQVAVGYSKTGNWGQSHKKNWADDGPLLEFCAAMAGSSHPSLIWQNG